MKESVNRRSEVKDYQILQIKNIYEIRKVVYEFDDVFSPSLSDRLLNLDSYAEKLYHNAIVFAALKGDEFIGFIAFYSNDKNMHEAYLTQIAVKPKARNINIGKNLLDLCIETSKNNGMSTIKLEVYKENSKVIEFYKKHGFHFCGDASAESIYMLKRLE